MADGHHLLSLAHPYELLSFNPSVVLVIDIHRTHTAVTDTHNDVRQRQSKKEPLCACVCLCVCVRLYRCVQFFHCFVCPDGSCPHLVLAPQTRGSTTRSKTNANLVYFRLHVVGRNTVSFPGCFLTSCNVCLSVRLTTTGLARHFRFFSQIDRTS